MIRYTIALISLFFLLSFSLPEGDLSERFYADIEKKYLQSNVLAYNYHVTQFDSTGKIIQKTMRGIIHQSKTKYAYDLDNVKVAFEDSFYLIVYPEKKEMFYHIISDSLKKQTQNFDIQKFVKQLRDNRIKVQVDSSCNDAESNCYNLIYGQLDKDLYKIKINKKTGYIDYLRIDYYGASDQNTIGNYVLEIRYSNYKTIPINKFNPLIEFVTKQNGLLSPNQKYKDFKINKF